MNRGHVLYLVERGFEEVFDALNLKGEQVEKLYFGQAAGLLGRCGADLIMIDCGYEARKGLKLLRELKEAHPEIPVFLLAEDSVESAAEAFRAGARQYFAKPVNIFELQESVKAILKIKRTARERREPLILRSPQEDGGFVEQATSDKPASILRVMKFIEENLSEDITLEMLASEAALSKYHFCRYFYKYTGMTPMKFVGMRRIEKAIQLFRKKGLNVSKVAYNTGFNNLNTFNNQFKKVTGLTPALYQSMLRRGPEQSLAAGAGQ